MTMGISVNEIVQDTPTRTSTSTASASASRNPTASSGISHSGALCVGSGSHTHMATAPSTPATRTTVVYAVNQWLRCCSVDWAAAARVDSICGWPVCACACGSRP